MVTYKGGDCEDDFKLLKYNDPNIKLSFWSVNGVLNDLATKERSLKLQGIVNIRKQIVEIPQYHPL